MRTKINLLLLFLVVSVGMSGQYSINEPYVFPVKPGSEQWKSFTTGQQMVDACQIPVDILQQLTTEALAKTCLDYPLFFEYTASNSEREGIAQVISQFNGLQELSKRMDGASQLLVIYEKMPVVITPITKEAGSSDTLLRMGYLELLLSSDAFFNTLNLSDLNKLKKTAVDKYAIKVKAKDVYSLFGIQKSLLLGAKVLDKTDYARIASPQRQIIKDFIKQYELSTPQLITEVSKILYE